MKVYALLGTYEYEGSHLIGIYSTKEKALKAKDAFTAEEEWFDDFEIKEKVIDAKASYLEELDAKASFME